MHDSGSRECEILLSRIKDLEKKVEHLRISRRVLMNLLLQIEKEKGAQIFRLMEENRRLQRTNLRYAQNLWLKNKQLQELNTDKLN
ncbi:MAG: translation initiation factor 2 [Syntrophomonadaceae bacterium]|nr:translation initiation factor 2 [Syntrophomonadaceae bacterium]